jgi:predicted GNAT family acetyltransferase
MVEYLTEDDARAAGIRIEREDDRSRFALVRTGPGGEREVIGEAHYTLLGEHGINFDHTVVLPGFRGTGLSQLLAHHALTDVVVQGRSVRASCWFIDEYLEQHPELRQTGDAP